MAMTWQAEQAIKILCKENPDWERWEIEHAVFTVSPYCTPEERRIWDRFQELCPRPTIPCFCGCCPECKDK
jgi:hypothetical protein